MMTDEDLTPRPPGGLSEKIFRRHRERLAIVYIRQSTVQQEVQERLSLVFVTFLELGSVGKVIRSFRDRALAIPRRDRFGDVVWRVPTASMLTGILKNPAYAGAFVYGRTRSRHATYPSGKLKTARCPMAEWKIVVKDRYPGYLDWRALSGSKRCCATITQNTNGTKLAACLGTGQLCCRASPGADSAVTK